MRIPIGLAFAAVGLAQAVTIPPVRTSLNIGGQAVEVAAWATVSEAPSGFQLAVTVDLGGFQEKLTPVLAALLNRSERCGERLTVERAELSPAEPAGVLRATVHYERFACAKAFGKEVIKRLAGGNAVVEVMLTPSVGDGGIALATEVRKIDADGSLGDVLRSGAFGDSIRERIAASIEAALRKSADLKSMLPPEMAGGARIRSARFADGGAGRLWLTASGEIRLGAEEFGIAAKKLAR